MARQTEKKSSKTSSRQIAKQIAEFASDKKAEDIIVLDMRKIVNFCDYFVICSGNTNRQVKAIAEGIEEGLTKLNIQASLTSGSKTSDWIVFDFGDVVTHIFQKQLREFYRLEYLWQEAKPIEWQS